MIDRAIRWRVSVFAVALLMFLTLWLFNTRESNLIIQFGISPEDFDGVEVLVDGAVAGTLQRTGGATRTGFRIGKGEHVVLLNHPRYASEPARIAIDSVTPRVMLLVDFAQVFRNGRTETVIVMDP